MPESFGLCLVLNQKHYFYTFNTKACAMRKLIYVPIIHSAADLGSLGKEMRQAQYSDSGASRFEKHTQTIDGYWQAIESYFDRFDVENTKLKIYQDGMFLEGEMALRIINDGISAGSKNSIIISKLIQRGAALMQTEDFEMVMDEYNAIQAMLKSKTYVRKIFHLLRYKLLKPILLHRRDRYISRRIGETLALNETGILFIGAFHHIIQRLPKDISVIELKQIEKVRKYQKTFQSLSKATIPQLDKLAEYLTEKI